MSLQTRVGRLERSTLTSRVVPRRILMIESSGHPPRFATGRYGVDSLTVPTEYARDPMAGLTDEQRALIRPEHRLVVITANRHRRSEAP